MILRLSGLTGESVIPLSPLIAITPFRSTAHSDQVRTAHDVFILVFSSIRDSFLFSISPSSTIKIFLTASEQFSGSVRPCLMLSSVTACFNSSAHEFRGAGSTLTTRPSEIESILKLCCNISFEKLFWVRKSSSSLYMPSIMAAQKQKNESLENVRTHLPKNLWTRTKTKYQTIEHINKKQRKCNAKSLVDSPKYQSTKKSSACPGGIRNNFSHSCEKRRHQFAFIVSRDRAEGGAGGALAPPLFCKNKNKLNKKNLTRKFSFTHSSLAPPPLENLLRGPWYLLWFDEGLTVLISRCLAPWRKESFSKDSS